MSSLKVKSVVDAAKVVEDEMDSVAESVATESVAESGSDSGLEEMSPAEALIASIVSMEEQLKQLKKAARAALKGKP